MASKLVAAPGSGQSSIKTGDELAEEILSYHRDENYKIVKLRVGNGSGGLP